MAGFSDNDNNYALKLGHLSFVLTFPILKCIAWEDLHDLNGQSYYFRPFLKDLGQLNRSTLELAPALILKSTAFTQLIKHVKV